MLHYLLFQKYLHFLMSLYPAAEPEDFTPLGTTTVVFPVGGTPSTECSTFTIQSDTELEGDHQFIVEIMDISSDPPNAEIIAPSTTTITITDDESE